MKRERGGVAQAQGELAEVEDMIAIDPTGFVLEHLPENVRTEIATRLLFEPGVLEEIERRIAESEEGYTLADILADPARQRTLQAELTARRYEMREQLRTQHEAGRVMQANAGEVIAEVNRCRQNDRGA